MTVFVKQLSSMELFWDIISDCSGTSLEIINKKFHKEYFDEYLTNVRRGPITVVVETQYTDREIIQMSTKISKIAPINQSLLHDRWLQNRQGRYWNHIKRTGKRTGGRHP